MIKIIAVNLSFRQTPLNGLNFEINQMKSTLTILCVLIANLVYAQDGGSPKLLIKNDRIDYIKLDKLSIDVNIKDNLATTAMTMRFHNNTNRVLEGELNFPLGKGQNTVI